MMSKAFDKKQRKQAQKQAEDAYVLFMVNYVQTLANDKNIALQLHQFMLQQ